MIVKRKQNRIELVTRPNSPIQRALRLVEAISRDLVSQLMKVLGTRRLMYITFDEFEKVMANCLDVFMTWDDEYDKLQVSDANNANLIL